MKNKSAPAKFRQLLADPGFIMALGIWDPYTARVSEALGVEF